MSVFYCFLNSEVRTLRLGWAQNTVATEAENRVPRISNKNNYMNITTYCRSCHHTWKLLVVALEDAGMRSVMSLGSEAVCSLVPTGPLRYPEAVASVAGQALHQSPSGPRHVHPHLSHQSQLSQHQAVHGIVSHRPRGSPQDLRLRK